MSRVVGRYRHGDRTIQLQKIGRALFASTRIRYWVGSAASESRVCPHGLMNAVRSGPRDFNRASAHSSENAHHQPWFSFFVRRTEHFHLPLPRSEPCRMAETRTEIHVNRDRQRHLLPAQSHGHRTPPAQNRKARTTRKEPMNDLWTSPVLKP